MKLKNRLRLLAVAKMLDRWVLRIRLRQGPDSEAPAQGDSMKELRLGKGFTVRVDLTEWALLFFVHWTPGMIGIHFLCFSLTWWLL